MANEARVFAEGVDNVVVRQITVADATALAKGTMLVYGAATRTGIAHSIQYQRPLGFTTSSKEASDGFTEIGVQRTGVVVATVDAATNTGDLMGLGATANELRPINTPLVPTLAPYGISYQLLNTFVGRALEDIASGGRGRVALNLM